MNELVKLGISEESIRRMITLDTEILNLDESDIEKKIKLLRIIDCSNIQIIDIITTYPYYLRRDRFDIEDLIKTLVSYGFTYINVLFQANPMILNLDTFEIKRYIDKRKEKESLKDIVDDLETHTYLFDEI